MKKHAKIIIAILIIILIIYGIYYYIKVKRKEAYVELEINGQKLTITEEANKEIDLQTLNCENETTVKINLKNTKININENIINDPQEIFI